MRRLPWLALTLGALLATQVAVAHESPEEHAHDAHPAPAHDPASEHGHDGASEHGHGGHHQEFNWFHGLVGEKAGVEPSLLWRAPGTPVPLAALLLNTAILFYLLGRMGGPAIKKGLVERKQRIAGDIQAAAAMKAEAEEQLAHYEQQLSQMEAEMERIKQDMREQGQLERERILSDAKSRREVMERDALELIAQELNSARETVAQTVAREAIKTARELIAKSLNAQDQERLAQDLMSSVDSNVKREVRS